jgi:histidine triad (HIT) family protein
MRTKTLTTILLAGALSAGLVLPFAYPHAQTPLAGPVAQIGDDFPGAEDPNSPFDKIVRHELPAARVYEDADVLVFLSNKPLTRGHALVISKTSHARSLIAMPPQMLAKMMAAARRVMIAQRRVLGTTGALVLEANGTEQTIPHMHIHVIPAKPGDHAVALLSSHAKMNDAEINALAARIAAAMPPP